MGALSTHPGKRRVKKLSRFTNDTRPSLARPFFGSSRNTPPHKGKRNVVRFSAAVCGEERCVTTQRTAEKEPEGYSHI